jgi:ABC-2 type transport system ATP-binding protein
LSEDGLTLTYDFDRHAERTGIPSLLTAMRDAGIGFKDLDTRESSLEDIFVGLVKGKTGVAPAQAGASGSQGDTPEVPASAGTTEGQP